MYLLLPCQMRHINSMSNGNILAQIRCNSLPCTVRTSRQRPCNQRVCCLQKLAYRALGPANWSGPKLLLTVQGGMNRMNVAYKQNTYCYIYVYRLRGIRSVGYLHLRPLPRHHLIHNKDLLEAWHDFKEWDGTIEF